MGALAVKPGLSNFCSRKFAFRSDIQGPMSVINVRKPIPGILKLSVPHPWRYIREILSFAKTNHVDAGSHASYGDAIWAQVALVYEGLILEDLCLCENKHP